MNKETFPKRIFREQTKIQSVREVQIVYRTISELVVNINCFNAAKVKKNNDLAKHFFID